MDKKEILFQLKRLSKEDISWIVGKVQSQLDAPIERSDFERDFYDSLNDEIFLVTQKRLNYHLFKKTIGYQKFRESYIFVETFLSSLPEKLTKVEKIKFYKLISHLVVRYMFDRGYLITMRTASNCFDAFPSLLDKAFPGYAVSGLLKFAIKAKTHRVRLVS